MSTDDGGTAFPSHFVDNFEGMTLRDWFAGMALQGEISTQCESGGWINSPLRFKETAEKCYALADAMLVAKGT